MGKAKPRVRKAKPLVFVGSSSEKSEVAREVCNELADLANVHPWWKSNEFGREPSATTIDSLLAATREYDFGLFILTPDDVTTSRGESQFSARDNVLFEYGLFLGSLGTQRTSAIIEHREQKLSKKDGRQASVKGNVKIPSDLLGVQLKRFTYTDDDNLKSQIGVVLSEFREAIERGGRRPPFTINGEWKFDSAAKEFLFDIQLQSIHLYRGRMAHKNQKLLLVARKHDKYVSDKEDKLIAKSAPRGVSDTDAQIALRARGDCFERVTTGDRVDGYLYLVPEDIDVDGCETMSALENEGCMLIGGFPVGYTLPSLRRGQDSDADQSLPPMPGGVLVP
jgi:predicted nucleotide-binding protein